MIHFLTYADDKMTIAQQHCIKSGLMNGADKAYDFTPNNMSQWFRKSFKGILEQVYPRTNSKGYWLWKPYFIDLVMQDANDGDVVVYCDSGIEIINGLHHIIDRMNEDIFFFGNGHNHLAWCKMDAFKMILPHHEKTDDTQVQASVIFFKVGINTRRFVKEWLLYSCMPNMIDDSPSYLMNSPSFQEHRHDQAILTCLQIKYGYELHWWASQGWEPQRHRWPKDNYPTIFLHHRKRNNEYK